LPKHNLKIESYLFFQRIETYFTIAEANKRFLKKH